MEISAITAAEGLNRAGSQFDKAASKIASATAGSDADGSVDTVDLSGAMVGLLAAKDNFGANLKVAQTADRMEREAINLLV